MIKTQMKYIIDNYLLLCDLYTLFDTGFEKQIQV